VFSRKGALVGRCRKDPGPEKGGNQIPKSVKGFKCDCTGKWSTSVQLVALRGKKINSTKAKEDLR